MRYELSPLRLIFVCARVDVVSVFAGATLSGTGSGAGGAGAG
ncbi:hypothetical protein HMPREF7215_2572 [Pyramidobacter piscolens W5455]|uniref:Uncharacterized protein n=1 Tax=Pyramidobacter piscolens W5455 TaxID=352165 RepID=A0ABM9ZSE4_9BACT|nr:hypothetical protein HMPREF7215_2572 [Pyramidobacter piscolens W5455]